MSRAEQLLKARPVQQVAALGDMARNTRRVNVLQAHRAVWTGHVLYAPMSSMLQLHGQAHVTSLTVEESISATYTAYAAALAMILTLVFIIKQVANKTGVLAKPYTTIFTFRLDLLSSITFYADEFCHWFSIEVMLFLLIVTVTTHVELITTWRHKFSPPLIMGTTNAFLLLGDIFDFCRFLLIRHFVTKFTLIFKFEQISLNIFWLNSNFDSN